MLKPLKCFKELPQPSVILLVLCSCLLLDKACQPPRSLRQEWGEEGGLGVFLQCKWIVLSLSRWRGRTSSKCCLHKTRPHSSQMNKNCHAQNHNYKPTYSLQRWGTTLSGTHWSFPVCKLGEDPLSLSLVCNLRLLYSKGGIRAERTKFNKPNYHALISIRGKPRWDTCRLNLYPDKPGTSVNVPYLW